MLSAAETSLKVAGGYVLTSQPTARQHILSALHSTAPCLPQLSAINFNFAFGIFIF